MTTKATAQQIDAAVKLAQGAPDLVARVATLDPAVAANVGAALKGQAKTQWGRILVAGIGYAAMKYGLGWSQEVDEIAAGAVLVAGHFIADGTTTAVHWITARVLKA